MTTPITPFEGILLSEDRRGAVMYDAASGWVFGPLFPTAEEVQAFLAYLGEDKDPRLMDDEELEAALSRFRTCAEPAP